MKTPIVARKTMEGRLERMHFRHQKEISDLQEKHQEEMEKMRKDLYDVIDRLTEVAIICEERKGNRYDERWRLVMELEPEMIVRALERGNDDQMISWIGQYIGKMVSQKLKVCNIQRPESLRMGRG